MVSFELDTATHGPMLRNHLRSSMKGQGHDFRSDGGDWARFDLLTPADVWLSRRVYGKELGKFLSQYTCSAMLTYDVRIAVASMSYRAVEDGPLGGRR